MSYGKELILDLHDCDNAVMNREDITAYFIVLCRLIDMERCDLHFWDYKGYEPEYRKAPPHLKGTSAIQFIKTSNITIHTLDEMKRVYLNIFSCKDFSSEIVIDYTVKYFCGRIVNKIEAQRI